MDKKSRIYIVNHNNIVGLGLINFLRKKGFTNLILANRSEVDLADQRSVYSFFKKKKPDYCILTPIKEGGIVANITYPAELIYENIVIQSNVIHNAWKTGVKKLLFYASSCVYPKGYSQPMKEEYLLTGPLEPTNEPYAVAKIAGIKMCQAYNRQYGTHFISVIPATVFGPNDNFDLRTSHVISALMRKFHEAKVNKKSRVVVWGSGEPKREFIYIDDLTSASLFLLEQAGSLEVVNIGVGLDFSISELAEMIKKIVGFNGNIILDRNKPNGVSRKLLDISILNSQGWRPKVGIHRGLELTYCWYRNGFLK